MPTSLPRRVTIIGTGLIGGSLGLSLGKLRADGATHITGFDQPAVLEEALARGAIDAAADSLAESVAEADLVVIAVPLAASLTVLSEIAPHVREGALVTDVGSVKAPVLAHAAAVLPEGVRFVGGHPMAGAAHGGIAHADPLLFENATYVLCARENFRDGTDGGADGLSLRAHEPELVAFAEASGGRVFVMSAERHDRIAALVSHLPQLLAVALTTFAGDAHRDDEAVLHLAAGGFRDMTRIATSPYSIWRDIIAGNHGPLLDTLGAFAAHLQRFRSRVAGEDHDALAEAFGAARAAREAIPATSKGFLAPLADLYVYAADEPGVLHRMTSALAAERINIKDIELLKVRLGEQGAFRIAFLTRAEANAAAELLRAEGFTIATR